MNGLAGIWWRLWRSGSNTVHRYLVKEPVRGVSVLGVLVFIGILVAIGVRLLLLFLYNHHQYSVVADILIDKLIALFFFSLFFLVSMSTTLVTWSALFRTESARFHAQLPISNRSLYWGAATEGGLWAGWALLVLALPMLIGLCTNSQQTGFFLLAGVLAVIGFLLCCMSVGALGSMALARFMPLIQNNGRWLIVIACLVFCAVFFVLIGGMDKRGNNLDYFNAVFDRISFIHNPYLPSHWAQQSISHALSSYWGDWLYYIGLLYLSSAALFLIGEQVASRRLRVDIDRVIGRGEKHRRNRSRAWKPLRLLPNDIALLVAKDMRLFIRDSTQIMQFLLFFGLLGFYIALLPRIGQAFLHQSWWSSTVSVLNLLAVSMALATFTGRFVYPLLSLEGKRLWVLVLAPWHSRLVVTAKFTFAVLVGAPISTILVALSGIMLQQSALVICHQAMVTICMAIGLSAAALGLGARLADYGEDNPAKLVAGYGGTINLLLSLVYTALMIIGAAAPIYLHPPLLGWAIGSLSVLLITAVWTRGFLQLAYRAFGRQSGHHE